MDNLKTMTKTKALDLDKNQLDLLKEKLEEYVPDKTVWAYGSRVDWKADEKSDLDLVVFDASLSEISNLREALEESNLLISVDVLNWEDIPDSFKKNIKKKYFAIQESSVPPGWQRVRLEDVVEVNPREKLSKGAVAKKVSMDDLGLFQRKIRSHSESLYKGGSKFRNGDTLIARITPCLENGKTAFVDIFQKGEIGFGSTEFIVLRERDKLTDKDFIYYLAVSPNFREVAIKSMTGTSGRQRVSIDEIRNYAFSLPPLNEQKAITEILSSLDDKIDLLHRQNKTLEDLAETLFHKYFITDANPDWEVGKLSDFVDHKKIAIKPSDNPSIIYSHYSIPAFDESRAPIEESGESIKSSKYKVFYQSILVSKLNPRFPRIWPIFREVNNRAICSTEFQVILRKDKNALSFIYCFLKSKFATESLINCADGTSGSHQRVKPEDILNLPVVRADNDTINKFSNCADDLHNKINRNCSSIHQMKELRDILLQELLSRKIQFCH